MTAKKWIKASALVIVFVIGCYLSYWRGWSTGNWEGFNRGDTACIQSPVQVKHHYEFKQHGVSIFRFDLDTGESCWLQLSKEDDAEEKYLVNPMQHCSQ
jgi:hypothetical protein